MKSAIKRMILDVPDIACSNIRKEFYIKSLEERNKEIIYPAYHKAHKEIENLMQEQDEYER